MSIHNSDYIPFSSTVVVAAAVVVVVVTVVDDMGAGDVDLVVGIMLVVVVGDGVDVVSVAPGVAKHV